jgi:hypothetical protein
VIRLAVLALGAASPAHAALELTQTTYGCDRGVVIPAAYVSDGVETAVVTLMYEGRMFSLVGQAVEGAVRYAWPSDGAGYVWQVGGTTGRLSWRAADGTEALLLTCTAQQ